MRSPMGEILRLGLTALALAFLPLGSSIPADADAGPAIGSGAFTCGALYVDAGGEGGFGRLPNPPTEKRRKRPKPSLPPPVEDEAGAPALVTRPRGAPI